ncbi:hypothetical protein N7493_010100 [Penicillium malachiteum]|uniref:Uncharacterized protein n=1 Tax=Penicillium malachiteum TaxID=1324776 RepID=A0AAD6MS64_9EURO|nr:hypothetical protein N7493_010100 [Penicillium malachiteum]
MVRMSGWGALRWWPIKEVGEEPERASASSGSIECLNSDSSGYRDLEGTRATPGEKDGGGLTGAASPGDVMDTNCFVRG